MRRAFFLLLLAGTACAAYADPAPPARTVRFHFPSTMTGFAGSRPGACQTIGVARVEAGGKVTDVPQSFTHECRCGAPCAHPALIASAYQDLSSPLEWDASGLVTV